MTQRQVLARDVLLLVLALVGPSLVMRQRRGRGWIIDDVEVAVTLSGVVCLAAALGLSWAIRTGSQVRGRPALYVVLAIYTALGAGVSTWRVIHEQEIAAGLGLLAAYGATTAQVFLISTARRERLDSGS